MAADHGHTDIVELLLDCGIDLNVIGQVSNLIDTSGLIYLQWCHHVNLSYYLNQHGYAPLHFASYNGHVDTIRYLISQGADTTIKDNQSETPMEKIKSHDPNRDEIIRLFDEKQLQGFAII